MLKAYGLNEDVLALAFKEAQNEDTLQWYVKGVPNADFYLALHPFLKKWHITRNATKVTIGKFYIKIDSNFARKGSRPDNVYRFVDKFSKSKSISPADQLMFYGIDPEIKALQASAKHCTEQVQILNTEVADLKEQLQLSKERLYVAHSARFSLFNVCQW